MSDTPPRWTPDDPLSVAARDALTAMLEWGERIDREASAVGAHLLLTDRRLVVVRDGFDFRPRSGIRSWPLDGKLVLRLEPGRLVIEHGRPAVGVFHTDAQAAAVRSLVAKARRAALRGEGVDRPPSRG
jgi:hypothetical protein